MAKSELGTVRRYVRSGSRGTNDRIEILSGLEPGDQLVVPE